MTDTMTDTTTAIRGYDYGSPRAAHSPVSLDELRQLEAAVGWTEDDARVLRDAAAVLTPRAEALVDHLRAQIGRQPHLAKWFFGPDGKPDEGYKAAVKQRFVRWVTDICTRPHDQAWLDYQEEIGLRHTPEKKNKTDHARTPDVVPLRYLFAFAAPTALAVAQFLAPAGWPAAKIDAAQRAWTKAVILEITLWSRPYVRGGLW